MFDRSTICARLYEAGRVWEPAIGVMVRWDIPGLERTPGSASGIEVLDELCPRIEVRPTAVNLVGRNRVRQAVERAARAAIGAQPSGTD